MSFLSCLSTSVQLAWALDHSLAFSATIFHSFFSLSNFEERICRATRVRTSFLSWVLMSLATRSFEAESRN